MERRLAAILAANVVCYSRLVRVEEEGTIAALKTLRADLFDPKIAASHDRFGSMVLKNSTSLAECWGFEALRFQVWGSGHLAV